MAAFFLPLVFVPEFTILSAFRVDSECCIVCYFQPLSKRAESSNFTINSHIKIRKILMIFHKKLKIAPSKLMVIHIFC